MSNETNKNFLQPGIVWDFFDTPEVLNCAVTAINGSGGALLQVVASLAQQCHAIAVRDGIQSEFIGVYKGASGQETLACIIGGPGDNTLLAFFEKGDRICLRSMNTSSITVGSLVIHFISHT